MEISERLRGTQSMTRVSGRGQSPLRNSSPLRAPRLMLDNGLGEITSLASPVFGESQDDESLCSDAEPPEHVCITDQKSCLSVPTTFDYPLKLNGTRARDYLPSISPQVPRSSPSKRSVSPPKTIDSVCEGKRRPVPIPFEDLTDVEPSTSASSQTLFVPSIIPPTS